MSWVPYTIDMQKYIKKAMKRSFKQLRIFSVLIISFINLQRKFETSILEKPFTIKHWIDKVLLRVHKVLARL